MKVKHFITTSGIILGGLLASQGASAVVTYQGSSDVQFTFSSSLSLAVAGGDFIITDLFPGNRDISNEVTLTVSTNNATGYALSATVGNDTTYNSTALLATGGASIAMMPSGNALTSGTWGYTLDNGTTYGALSKTIDTTLNKTVNSIGTAAPGYGGTDSTRMKIGAYAAIDQTPGVYNNVVNFKAVSNVATHTVTLAKGNNVSSVTLGGSGTSGDYTSGTPVSIAATCKSGHNFVNWALSNDYGKITNASAASTTYNVGPGDVTITAYCDGEEEGGDPIQDVTVASCPSVPTVLTDVRDGEQYPVGLLADGKCWMLENLRLDISNPAVQANLSSTTTNAPDNVLSYLINGGGSSPYPASGVSATWTSSYDVPSIFAGEKETIQPAAGPAPAAKIGVYYNYCAASAGSYCYKHNQSGVSNYDICPAGWHIPIGGVDQSGEYGILFNAYNQDNGAFLSALKMPIAGYYLGDISKAAQTGYLWASARNSSPFSTYNMWFIWYGVQSGGLNTGVSSDRIVGVPVRCVLSS